MKILTFSIDSSPSEAFKWSFLLVTVVISWMVVLWWKKNTGFKLNLPPGPPALPLIGNLHQIGYNTHRSFQALAKKHGPIMLLKLGSINTVVISSPDMAREILKTNDLFCASRPAKLASKLLNYNKDLVFEPYGDRFREVRKLCSTELFTTRRVGRSLKIVRDELRQLVDHLLQASNSQQVVNMKDRLKEFGFNTITRPLMSKTYFGPNASKADAADAHEFMEMLESLLESYSKPSLGDLFPMLVWLDWNILWMKSVERRVSAFLQKVIDEHLAKGRVSEESADFVDIMGEFFDNDAQCLKGMLQNLLAAGTETSSGAVEFALAELMHHPEMIAKAQREVQAVVGSERMVEESDLPKLDYLTAIIKETFRLHPPAALLPHAADKLLTVGGYHIPQKSSIFVNVFAIGRDPQIWEAPERFNPDRFVGSTIDIFGQDFELLPFGSGRRICPGMYLGMKTVQLALSNLLHGFDWALPDGVKQLPRIEAPGLANRMAECLRARVKARLAPEAYKSLQVNA